MREIKFRGISVETKEFIYGHFMRHKNFTEENFYIKEGSKNPIIWYEVRRETVGQFTGLHDKNGIPVYEGDVVKCFDHPTGVDSATGEVYFSQGCFRVKDTICPLSDFGTAWTEVIGNIHETPELQ